MVRSQSVPLLSVNMVLNKKNCQKISQHYLKRKTFKYSRLSLSRSPRGSLKYFKISVPQHIRLAELKKK